MMITDEYISIDEHKQVMQNIQDKYQEEYMTVEDWNSIYDIELSTLKDT